jgi:uncharacterized protein
MRNGVKNITLGKVSIPLTQYASQGNAVLGIRDSGKSYSATYLAEQLYAGGIPFVAFDPSGVWKFLRVPGKGRGLPVVVAGGKAPDLPLTPQSAPEIVRAAMRANVSLVLDLYDIHMSKADWSRIVESCVRVLLYENGDHGLRHIFIEEAAEFAPQQIAGDKAKVYAEVEKLARIGGNALLGYTLINQRAEQVNKAVLELCDCLLLHRQKGKNSLNSLSKWLEYSQGGETKEIIKGLPTLPSGECWVWPAGAEHATHVRMPQKETFHPDRRALIANPAAANVQRVDATKFVTELRGSLEKYVDEAKANDPAELKKRIKELERQLAAQPAACATPKELEAAERRGSQTGFQAGMCRAFTEIEALAERMTKALPAIDARPETPARRVEPATRAARLPEKTPTVARARQIGGRVLGSGEKLSKAERLILTALAQYPQGRTKTQVAILTGYAHNGGGFNNAIAALRTKGYIEGDSNRLTFTDAGLDALGTFEPLPEGAALLQHWLRQLGKAERAALETLAEAHPSALSKDDLARRAGYEPNGGGFNNALSRLRTLELISGRGEIRASEDLFS